MWPTPRLRAPRFLLNPKSAGLFGKWTEPLAKWTKPQQFNNTPHFVKADLSCTSEVTKFAVTVVNEQLIHSVPSRKAALDLNFLDKNQRKWSFLHLVPRFLLNPKWAVLLGKWAGLWAKWIKRRRIVPAVNYSPIPPFRLPNNRMPRVLITGGTDGIGREAALRLAAANNDVTISGRDSEKAAEVIRQCQQQFNNTPHFIKADLSSTSEVTKFAETVANEQFDICILNAGVMLPKNARTLEDREATIMTNLISSYMIAHRILETRREERPLHFVFSTSILVKFHCATPIGPRFFNPKKVSDWQKAIQPSDVSGAGKYTISKIGLATLSSAISFAQYPNVTATSVHPGTVYTNIMSNLPSRQKFYIRLARPFITSLSDAGANLVRAAECPLPGGMFYQTNGVAKLPELVYSEKTLEAFDEVFQQFRIR